MRLDAGRWMRSVHDQLSRQREAVLAAAAADMSAMQGSDRADVVAAVFDVVADSLLRGFVDGGLAADAGDNVGRHYASLGVRAHLMLLDLVACAHALSRQVVQACGSNDVQVGSLAEALRVTGQCVGLISEVAVASHAAAPGTEIAAARFLELLSSGPEPDVLSAAAIAAGFDPEGTFVAACVDDGGGGEIRIDGARVVPCLDRTVVIAQNKSADALAEQVERLPIVVHAGVGSARPGVEGARDTVVDASLAIVVARARGEACCTFDEVWPAAIALADVQRLNPMLAVGDAALSRSPHLRETVRAYLDHGLSTAATARVLHLSPTGVRHRLSQWERLTGWVLNTAHGLTASTVALDWDALRR